MVTVIAVWGMSLITILVVIALVAIAKVWRDL